MRSTTKSFDDFPPHKARWVPADVRYEWRTFAQLCISSNMVSIRAKLNPPTPSTHINEMIVHSSQSVLKHWWWHDGMFFVFFVFLIVLFISWLLLSQWGGILPLSSFCFRSPLSLYDCWCLVWIWGSTYCLWVPWHSRMKSSNNIHLKGPVCKI